MRVALVGSLPAGTLFVTRLTGRPGSVRVQGWPGTVVKFEDRAQEQEIAALTQVDVMERIH